MTVEGLTWWTDGMRNLRLLCDEHGGEARARGEAHGQVYAGRRAAMVFDVVASRQRKYTQRVEPMVKKFAATPGAKTAPRPARKWITLADAAERLSVSPRTIRRFISEAPGRFIRTRWGGSWRPLGGAVVCRVLLFRFL